MRKMRKFLSAILILAMVFTLSSSTAFAVLEIESKGNLDYLEFTKTFTVQEGDSLPDDVFKFKMVPVTLDTEGEIDSVNKIPRYSGIELSNDTATVTFPATIGESSINQTGIFDLSSVKSKFKDVMDTNTAQYALFRYEIYEVVDKNDASYDKDVIYDEDTKYIVDVWVDRKGEIQVYLSAPEGTSTNTKKPIKFTNTYKAEAETSELKIKKTVEGTMGELTKDFNFKLTINSTKNNETFTGTKHESDGTVIGNSFEITANTEYSFTLKHGEYISIKNIPTGYTYEVIETDDDKYTTTVTCTREENDSTSSIGITVDGGVYNAANENNYTPIVKGINIVEFKNTALYTLPKDNITKIKFTKIFKNEVGNVLPDATFNFTMTPDTATAGETYDGLPVYAGIELKESSVSLEYRALSGSQQEGEFVLETKTPLTGPAVYKYIVQEVPDSGTDKVNPIQYDDSQYKVSLIVDNTGAVTKTIISKVNDTSNATDTQISFINTCSSDNLTIEKKVTGELGDTNKDFSFKLIIPVEGDNIKLSENTESLPNSFDGIIERKNGDNEAVTINVGTAYEFTLKDSEALVIKGVPQGMIYTVEEIKDKNYDTSITYLGEVKDSSGNTVSTTSKNVDGNVYDASASGQNTPIVMGGNTVIFTNNRDSTTNTGLDIDVTPYIVVFAIAVVGIVFFATRKRENRF